MRVRSLLGVFASMLTLCSIASCVERSPDPEQVPFEKLSGKELVKRLNEPGSRSRAFYELWRRSEKTEDEGFDSFDQRHADPEIVVCPQEKGEPPIYIVLSYFFDRASSVSSDSYPIERPNEIFPSGPGLPNHGPADTPVIDAFTADGRRVQPFGGNNVLVGLLADINCDGLIELAEVTNYGVEGVNYAQGLKISVAKETEKPLFAVVLNWGADEWTFRLADSDGDGISDIEAGPRTVDGINPKVVWKWDPAKHEYVGPAGSPGDHFRVINAGDVWKELERLKSAKLTFPADPEAVTEKDDAPVRKPSATPAASAGEPYRYVSLKGVSNAEICRFMAHGKSELDRERDAIIQSHLPENFWTADPKQAALDLLNANRKDAHRATFQIAIDDRDKSAQPPARCSIAFSDSSARCYNAVDGHYFLRVDPEDSYLAFARSWAGGVVFYNAVHDRPAFDLRLCPLSYEDARKIADVIWWLDHARSRDSRVGTLGVRMTSSTADGGGELVLRVDGSPSIDRSGTLWAGCLSERWNGDYDHDCFLNFAAYLIGEALPARLGKDWTQYEPKHDQDIVSRGNSAPEYEAEEQKRLSELSQRFLAWCALDQDRISFAIVAEAERLAAELVVDSAAGRLRTIQSELPPAGPPKRTYEQISAELKQLPYPVAVEDREQRKEIERKRAPLQKEIDSLLQDGRAGSLDHLRQATGLALRQLAVANAPEQLFTWAISMSEGHQWALQRLALIDRKHYADALTSLMQQTDGKWTRQFFAELMRADPERAASIAREMPPEKKDALAISAFLLLRDAENIPDEAKRIATVIEILHDPKTGWEERSRAIELLVPQEAPLRYPGRQVDDALTKLFDPGQADDRINFSLEKACMALALRGRTDLFERIAEQLQRTNQLGIYDGVLRALTVLAQVEPARFNPRLMEIVKPELSRTNKNMSEILWAVWSADLRELQPDLERIATRSVDELEDAKAHSFGGAETPVTGRFHFARQILGLWTEPDTLTRARLLTALALTEPYQFEDEGHSDRLARMKKEMTRLGAVLSEEDRQELSAFLGAFDADPTRRQDGPGLQEARQKAIAFVRKQLKL